VNGDFSLGNSAAITSSGGAPITIYVTGNVTLGDSATLGSHPPTNLQIVTKSDLADTETDTNRIRRFTAGNNLTLYGSLYGRSTDIKLGNNASVYGSVIGRTVVVGNNGSVHYDQALSDRQVCTFGKYNILRGTWREVYPTS